MKLVGFSGHPQCGYPLLTQAIEVSLDDKTMAIELRPRATETRVEFDAITACHVEGAIEVEKAVIAHLDRHKERPVTPFDSGSYSDVLKLIAGNLDSKGLDKEVLDKDEAVPSPSVVGGPGFKDLRWATCQTLAEMVGATRSRVSFFMNRFRSLGFIEYDGRIRVHKSLLNVILHDHESVQRGGAPLSARE
jgi:hypothetical protein